MVLVYISVMKLGALDESVGGVVVFDPDLA